MLLAADEIVVIGYSLPPTDFRPRILFQMLSVVRKEVPKIILVDPCVERVLPRYEGFLSLPIEPVAKSWVEWLGTVVE